jgi:hypothetical protein
MNNLIFTNHALERISDRKMNKNMILQAFSSPDSKNKGKKPDTTEFIKHTGSSTITLIAKQNEKNEWIALSAWIDPPYPGTKDYKEKKRYNAYQHAGFWGKIWLTIKSQLGL